MLFELKCEYLENPVGIDIQDSRLTWKLPLLPENDSVESVYLWIATDSVDLMTNKNESWKREFAGTTIFYRCENIHFREYTTYYWKVGYKTNRSDRYMVSDMAFFTTGIMQKEGWKGEWISDGKDKNDLPSSYFRKNFHLNGKVRKAWFTIASAGLHEISLNGKNRRSFSGSDVYPV